MVYDCLFGMMHEKKRRHKIRVAFEAGFPTVDIVMILLCRSANSSGRSASHTAGDRSGSAAATASHASHLPTTRNSKRKNVSVFPIFLKYIFCLIQIILWGKICFPILARWIFKRCGYMMCTVANAGKGTRRNQLQKYCTWLFYH
jgi:hypothetical protein